jgi:uncharacterized membrane protein
VTKTNPWHLVLIAVIGGVVFWVLEIALVASGRFALVPPITIAVALAVIGVIVVILALPVRRVAKREPNATVDPFYATRVVAIAKASSLIGALLGGGALGIAFFLLTRTVTAGGSLLMAVASIGGAIVLLAGGLVAEWMCTITPHDDDDPDEEAL